MIKILLTQGKVALVDNEDYPLISQYNWWAMKCREVWYAKGWVDRKEIRMHRFIMELNPNEQVDHINMNGLDNRRCNLRIATHSQNMMNRKKQLNCSSRYKGVTWYKDDKKWMAQIVFNKKRYHLGYFVDEIEAAKAYDKTAKKLFGEYARLNFPECC